MAEIKTHFEEYTITNGTVRWTEKEPEGAQTHGVGTALGCTGSLNTETEIKEVVKNCEGQPVRTWSVPQGMTGTFVGHMPVPVLRKAFGLSNIGLKKGIFSYGINSHGGAGIFTFETWDIEETIRKFMAFPNGSFTGGLKITIENGGDEIAQVEMTLKFMKDENKQFYYEAFEQELEDEDVKKKWMKEFDLELIKETATEAEGQSLMVNEDEDIDLKSLDNVTESSKDLAVKADEKTKK